ncbi:MAG: thioredoxin domain-containing protein [Candidatus Peribacteria bacterium]|jgi:protein-disulfide isomerase|nr:thioredoxin domain-containing protein [Candidatus Peribacteria bacterium]
MITKESNHTCAGHCGGKICGSILLVISVVLSAFAFYYAYQNYHLEVIRGGGKENFAAMNEFYKSEAFVKYVTEAQAQQIAAFDDQQGNQPAGETPTETVPSAPQVLTQSDIAALKEGAIIKGDENADITIIEFADANCSYCKRQIGQDKTVQTILASYPNVNLIYKNMPVLGSINEAQIIECFGENNPSKYYDFIDAVYSNNAGLENLYTIATSLGADAEAIKSCLGKGTYKAAVDAQMAEGQSFGITGTPSSVIINNANGEYKLIEGAYPASSFESAINELLNA